MFIPVPISMLKSQDYDSCLRFACDALYQQGVRNFIHYGFARTVNLYDPERIMSVIIDHHRVGVSLIEQSLTDPAASGFLFSGESNGNHA